MTTEPSAADGQMKRLLHLKGKTVHAPPHIGHASGNEDADAGRDRDHRSANALRTRVNAAVSTSSHTRIRSPPASTISNWPANPRVQPFVFASGAIVTGRIGASSCGPPGSTSNFRRQVKS